MDNPGAAEQNPGSFAEWDARTANVIPACAGMTAPPKQSSMSRRNLFHQARGSALPTQKVNNLLISALNGKSESRVSANRWNFLDSRRFFFRSLYPLLGEDQ
jgi:hypothetical protein